MYLDLSQTETWALGRIYTSGLLAGILLSLLPGVSPHNLTEPSRAQTRRGEETLLLVWVHPFGRRRELPDCWTRYQVSGCKLTDDRSLYRQADAVAFHHRDMGVATLPQEQRPPAQKWIWMNLESPTHAPRLQEFEGVYNLTLSYREDSDVPLPYGYLIPNALLDKVSAGRKVYPLGGTSPSDLVRPGLVAWVVSNWSESHARAAFYRRLQNYIQVEVFGRAGRPLPPGTVVELVRRYRFYLALENSQHTDYITEKLWNAVRGGAIPVVLGPSRENYERFLPPEAFIHVEDFARVQDLAEYLLRVRDSPALIEYHLRWTKNYSVYMTSLWDELYCTACWVVRKTRGKTTVVRNLAEWFDS